MTLTCQQVSQRYRTPAGTLTALENVNFTIQAQEFVSIVGPSGCGKTTLLKLLAGLLQPTAGRICCDHNSHNGRPQNAMVCWSLRLRRLLDPVIAAAHPIPKIAVLPLAMIVFGIGETSKIVLVAVAAFFPLAINTAAGIRQIPRLYFEVAHNYGASALMLCRRVIIPGSLPMIMTGLRLAVNIAFTITISVEIITAQKGLGAIIWLAWETLRTEELYAALTVIALLGVSINWSIKRLTIWLLPWQEQHHDEHA